MIASTLFVYLALTNALVTFSQLTLKTGSFIERLVLVDVRLVLFNLIPVF